MINEMNNFGEIAKLNVGTAVIVTGILVATPEESSHLKSRQKVWKLKEAVPLIIRCKRSAIHLISEKDRTSAAESQYISGSIPGTVSGGVCDSQIFYGTGFCLCAYTDHYRTGL